jgi:hypothetical protein
MRAKILLISLLVISCASIPPADMIDDNSSLLAIDVSISYIPLPLLPVYYHKPDRIYFVKFNENENLLTQTQIISANYINGYGGFILNAEPGKYVAIAAHFTKGENKDGTDFYLLFPKDLIKQSSIEIKSSMLGYMGHIKIDQQPVFGFSDKANNFDEVQLYFYNLIKQNPSILFSPTIEFTSHSINPNVKVKFVKYTNGTLISFEKNKDEFIKNQSDYFKNTKWYSILKN